MAKRSFFASMAIVALAIVYHPGINDVEAQSPSGLRYLGLGGNGNRTFVASGNVVYVLTSNGWHTWAELGIPEAPVPVDQMLFNNGSYIITMNGDGYVTFGPSWEYLGAIPGGAVNVEQSTWLEAKKRYR